MFARGILACALVSAFVVPSFVAAKEIVKFARFQSGDTVAHGIVDGDVVRQIQGDLFGNWKKTDKTFPLKDVKLLVPCQPTQVLALAGNYKSHLTSGGETTTTITTVTKIVTDGKGVAKSESNTTTESLKLGDVPPKFQIPQPFFKSPSCLIPTGEKIVLPKDAGPVHYEAELVIVIGRKAKNVPKQAALDYVFGVTCGNDVSARVWQKGDVQWWRAKGSDTFGPVGPYIVSGLNYDDLRVQMRLNGQVKQEERTSQFICDVSTTVSVISKHITLHPGDLIFTGTPGSTSEIKPGDVCEVEIEGVGVLRNPVVAEE